MIARGFLPAGYMHVRAVRPQNLLIAEDELGYRLVGVSYHDPVVLLVGDEG